MASARSLPRRPPQGIRWDRLGRVALLCVLGLVLYLYVGPTRSWFATWHESKVRAAQVRTLRAENAKLQAERKALQNPATLEADARKLGMVRGAEKGYVIRGLPAN
jgi:cell division protein FtsB